MWLMQLSFLVNMIIVKLETEVLGGIANIVADIIRQVSGITGTKTLAGAEI